MKQFIKQLWKDLGKGLLWFVCVYALVRIILGHPNAGIQDVETLAISISAFSLCWLVYAYLKEEVSGLVVSLNLSAASIFAYLRWGDFGLQNVQIAIGVVIIMAIIIFAIELVSTLKREFGAWWLVTVQLVAVVSFLFLMELLVPMVW